MASVFLVRHKIFVKQEDGTSVYYSEIDAIYKTRLAARRYLRDEMEFWEKMQYETIASIDSQVAVKKDNTERHYTISEWNLRE